MATNLPGMLSFLLCMTNSVVLPGGVWSARDGITHYRAQLSFTKSFFALSIKNRYAGMIECTSSPWLRNSCAAFSLIMLEGETP